MEHLTWFICSRIEHFFLFEAHPSLGFLDTVFPLSSLYLSGCLCSVSLPVKGLCREQTTTLNPFLTRPFCSY